MKVQHDPGQKAHYERIADPYEAHYFDEWSMRYRNEFIYPLLWKGVDLNGKRVAELACGPGYNSEALLAAFPSALPEGFDISPSACARYRERVGFPATEIDLTKPMHLADKYDAAFVVGGLHHCVADLPCTLTNVASLLKPGGIFMMLEPNSIHLLEFVRKLWYRLDSAFDAANEHALNHDELAEMARESFTPLDVTYLGGPAFFAVLNSMILRIPLSVKPILSPFLMSAERVWNRLPSRKLQNIFIARWIRK